MKQLLIALLSTICTIANAQTPEDTLKNDDVLKLLNAGLTIPLVITKIENSITDFDVSTNTIVKLTKEGVSGDVIQAMIISSNPTMIKKSISQEKKGGLHIFNKKWKLVEMYMNGKRKYSAEGSILQFFEGGTYISIGIDAKTGRSTEHEGGFEISENGKSITYFHERIAPVTYEITKLTSTEFETNGHGVVMRSISVVDQE